MSKKDEQGTNWGLKKGVDKMSSMKNRINMDEKLAGIIREHYRCTTPTSILSALCYSNPQLQSHCCNKLEPLEGGQPCSYCQHDPMKLCEYSCDVSKACLAAFAFRLGVGGDKVHTAVKKGLEMPYADLLSEIHKALGDTPDPQVATEQVASPETAPKTPEKASDKPPAASKPQAAPKVLALPSGTPSDLITTKEAALFWGCTPPNIYAKIKSGRIKAYVQSESTSKLVSRAEIERVKLETESNKKG